MRNRQSLWAWPPLLYLALFAVLPTGVVVFYSLLKRDFYGSVLREFSTVAWQRAIEAPHPTILARSVVLRSEPRHVARSGSSRRTALPLRIACDTEQDCR